MWVFQSNSYGLNIVTQVGVFTSHRTHLEENKAKEYSTMRSNSDDVSENFDAVQKGAQSRPRWKAP